MQATEANQAKYIDIHAHLNFHDYDIDRKEVLARIRQENIAVVNVGTDIKTSQEVVDLSDGKNFWAIVGIHPTEKAAMTEADWEKLKVLALQPNTVAIGECGMDISRIKNQELRVKSEILKTQKDLFERQIQMSLEVGKPLMLHIRDAYDESLEILNSYFSTHNSDNTGDVHFFAGDIEVAKKFLDLGFYLSFTGVITFAKEYEEVVRYIPLERILSETDCPYVTPVPHRGKRNEPLYVREVVKKIAEIKGQPLETVKTAIWQNAQKLFDL